MPKPYHFFKVILCHVCTTFAGEFDSNESSDTKLKNLLDQRPMGSKEFHPLSGHALLGFRLLPGPVSCNPYFLPSV